ncbi:MAG: hypothetical protein KAT71_03300 [Gammaproteobacteria bacterium]|nr:hypothetical protein [Gammaproteobacteria bacterium]
MSNLTNNSRASLFNTTNGSGGPNNLATVAKKVAYALSTMHNTLQAVCNLHGSSAASLKSESPELKAKEPSNNESGNFPPSQF